MRVTGDWKTPQEAETRADHYRRVLGQGWAVKVHPTPGLCSAFVINCTAREADNALHV